MNRYIDLNHLINEEINKYVKHNIVESLLFEAASIQDIYKKYYSDIDDSIFRSIIESDPTFNPQKPDKMGKYGKWLLNLYRDGNLNEEDLSKVKEYLSTFIKFYNRIENKDINSIKSLPQLYDIVKPFIENPEQSTSHQDEVRKLKEGAEKVYEDGTWLVVVPHTQETSCYYGKHTKWCTAAKNNNMFDKYNEKGNLYININKKTGKKYQFHFESDSYMNELDRPLEGDIADKIGMTDGLHDFYVNEIGDEAYLAFDFGRIFEHEKVDGLDHIYIIEDGEDTILAKIDSKKIITLYKCSYDEQVFRWSVKNRFIFIYKLSNGNKPEYVISKIYDSKTDKVMFNDASVVERVNSDLLFIIIKNKKYLYNLSINKIVSDLGNDVVKVKWLPKVNKQFNIEDYNDVLLILHTGFVYSLFDTFNYTYMTNPVIKHIKPYNLNKNGRANYKKTYAFFETTNDNNFYLDDDLNLIDAE